MTHTGKSKLGVIFGGRSAEHEVSLRSAQGVLRALDTDRFDAVLLGIGRDGRFRLGRAGQSTAQVVQQGDVITDLAACLMQCDAVFPLVHGPQGEDGTLQGLLECFAVPYVGSGVFASALCMDKARFKHWLKCHEGLPVAPYVSLQLPGSATDALAGAQGQVEALGYPLFVKPANLGSSVGISRVDSSAQLPEAIEMARRYDRSIVVEKGLVARELEVAILDDGVRPPLVSDVGEIVLPQGRWYDYETKYESDVAELALPATLDAFTRERARELALKTFLSVGARGLSRVDFFLETASGELYINEVNTLPGFTSISMYPKLIEHAGVSYRELITRLVDQALAERP